MDRHVGGLPDGGVAGVLAGVGGEGLADQQGGLGGRPLLRDLADPAPARAVGDGLKYFHCLTNLFIFSSEYVDYDQRAGDSVAARVRN